MREVEVRVLGPVELRVDGLLAPVERVQVRRMLAVLAMSAGATVSTDGLIEELWPGDQPKSPRAALRVVASRLRTALGGRAGVLRSSAHEYVLAIDDGAVDGRAFEALVARSVDGETALDELARLGAAFELWQGEPFGGAQGPPLLDRAAARLGELRLAGTVRRAEVLVDLGSPDRALAIVVPLVSDDVIDERLWAVHAVALARAGRRTEALAVIRRARRVLLEGHGLTPSDVLAAAERTILHPVVAAPPIEVAPALPPVYGRNSELVAAIQWLTRPAECPPCVLLVGPPGIGKSVLADVITARLGFPSLRARCDPDLADIDALTSVLGVDVARSGDGRSRTIRLVEELVGAVGVRAGDGPLLLVLDDLHWAGEVELRFLLRLVRTAALRNIGIIATLRHADGADAAVDVVRRDLIAKIEQYGNVCRVVLGGLDREASRRAYAVWRGSPPAPVETSALMELSAGNPYLIRAMADARLDLRGMRTDAARRLLGEVTNARLAALDDADEVVLRTAAVLGRTVDIALLAAAAERDQRAVAGSLDRALTARFLVADGPTVRFDHELTRLGLAADVGPAATAVLHAVATDAGRALGRDPLVIARHLLGAGALRADDRAARDFLAGADRASSRGDFDDAVRFLVAARSLEQDPVRRLDIQREEAWARDCSGDRAGALELYDDIFGSARRAGLRTIFGRAALGGAAFGGVVGGEPKRLARLLEALDDPPPDERLHLEIAIAAVTELERADRAVPDELDVLVERLAEDDEVGALRQSVEHRRAIRGPVSAALLADVEAFARTAERTGDVPLILDARERVVQARLTSGDLAGADDGRADLARVVRSHRWPRYVWTVALFDAVLTDLRLGPGPADELARRAMAIGREHGVGDAMNAYSMFRLSVAFRDSTIGELEPFIRAAIAAPGAPPAWHAVLAASLAEQGDVAGTARSLAEFWAGTGDRMPAFTQIGLALAAHAGSVVGDTATVRVCIDRLLPWSGNLLIVGVGAACFGAADAILADAMEQVGDPRAERFRQISAGVGFGRGRK